MGSVIEYTMHAKPGQYDNILNAYVAFADQFGKRNLSEDLILVTGDAEAGDPKTGVIRGFGVFVSDAEALDVISASMFVNFRDSVADLLTEVSVRADLDLVHVFVK